MQQAKPHTDAFGRVMGTLILLAGIAMLIGAFYTANNWLHQPIKGLEFLGTKSQVAPPPANIGAAALEFVRELVILGFMTMIGSILAGKGIALYLGAIHWAETHRPSKPTIAEPAPAPSTAKPDTPPPNATSTTS
jgi:hypothetical protein